MAKYKGLTLEANGFVDMPEVSAGLHRLGGNPKGSCGTSVLPDGTTCRGYAGTKGFKGAFPSPWLCRACIGHGRDPTALAPILSLLSVPLLHKDKAATNQVAPPPYSAKAAHLCPAVTGTART